MVVVAYICRNNGLVMRLPTPVLTNALAKGTQHDYRQVNICLYASDKERRTKNVLGLSTRQ